MAKASNYRLRFPSGEQCKFVSNAIDASGLIGKKIAELLGVSVRTLTDWKREKLTLPESAAEKIEKLFKVAIPVNVKRIERYWYTARAAKLGAQATVRKYGAICTDQKKRLAGWKKWWTEKGQYLPQGIENKPKEFYRPTKSEKLAEFTGIMLGDGGITNYQIAVTLNKKDDKDYAKYVAGMFQGLFGTRVGQTIRDSVVVITISRVNLVKYCQKIGLVKGHKIRQQIDIPKWIMRDMNYSKACLRGLVDTDGCIFSHKYSVNGKIYCYKKLQFSSRSKPLIASVKKIFQSIGINIRIDSRGDIRLDNISDVKKYFDLVGSSNPKHIRRYCD